VQLEPDASLQANTVLARIQGEGFFILILTKVGSPYLRVLMNKYE
jgi:hypothetical protein